MTLLQEIRARQVLEEEGLNLPVKIIHSENPKTIIGDRKFSLIFPKFMFNYVSNKDIDKLFVGLLTPKRKNFLNNFDAMIIDSQRGRNQDEKSRDEEYFKLMSRCKFALCPNGDFKWTYRFFEAIIFRAIPIIEEYSHLYEGYKYFKKEDKFIYSNEIVNFNLNKLKKEMTWT